MSEFLQGILHASQANVGEVRSKKWGRVSSYDPDKHAVKMIIDEDEDEEACETELITLGTIGVGDRTGIQIAPLGGATMDNTEGEHGEISIHDQTTGHMSVSMLGYTDTERPPGGENSKEEQDQQDSADPNDKQGWDEDPLGRKRLEGGEGIWRHKSGSFLKFYDDGTIQLFPKKDLQLYVKEEANIVVREGDLNATVDKGNLNATVTKGNLEVLVEEGNTEINTVVGDTNIQSTSGAINVSTDEGDVTVSAPAGNVSVSCLTAEIVAETLANLIAPEINAGLDPADVQQLCNEAFLLLFNNHIHPVPGGVSGAPTNPAMPGVESTVNFKAS